jgi:asparagine synthase (glutamine-hydrolysing)
VLLSGIGGDEVTGGVPTAIPELADLLVTMQYRQLARHLKAWALWQKRPWHFLLWEVLREFLPVTKFLTSIRPAPWISSEFAKQHERALSGYPERLRALGHSLPSLQENLHALDALRRQVAIAAKSSLADCETRYPYLDRNLVEFLYSVPREQLVRPGQRRSLMRRALRGIVPEEILTRRRKAYVSRQPANLLRERVGEILAIVNSSTTSQIDWIDPEALVKTMKAVESGDFQAYLPLIRTVLFEAWFEVAAAHSWIHSRPRSDAHSKPTRFSSEELEIRKKGVSAHAVQQAGNP